MLRLRFDDRSESEDDYSTTDSDREQEPSDNDGNSKNKELPIYEDFMPSPEESQPAAPREEPTPIVESKNFLEAALRAIIEDAVTRRTERATASREEETPSQSVAAKTPEEGQEPSEARKSKSKFQTKKEVVATAAALRKERDQYQRKLSQLAKLNGRLTELVADLRK